MQTAMAILLCMAAVLCVTRLQTGHAPREDARAASRMLYSPGEVLYDGDRVTAQVPSAGAVLSKQNGKIIIYLGDSAPEADVKVPNVSKLSAAAANKLITDAGLNIKIEGSKSHALGGEALVVSQYPAAGESVARGSVVTITVRFTDGED